MIKNKKVKVFLWAIISILQIAAVGGVMTLKKLVYKKAGVNHHIRYMKNEYSKTILTAGNINILTMILIAIMVLSIIMLYLHIRKNKKIKYKVISLIGVTIFSAIALFVLKGMGERMYYPYAVFAGVFVVFLQIFKSILL